MPRSCFALLATRSPLLSLQSEKPCFGIWALLLTAFPSQDSSPWSSQVVRCTVPRTWRCQTLVSATLRPSLTSFVRLPFLCLLFSPSALRLGALSAASPLLYPRITGVWQVFFRNEPSFVLMRIAIWSGYLLLFYLIIVCLLCNVLLSFTTCHIKAVIKAL